MKIKKIKINKSNNIIKKIKGCIKCHKIIKNSITRINLKNVKKKYDKLIKIKKKYIYNINMKDILKNIKNKYILEISKYFNKFHKIKKILTVK